MTVAIGGSLLGGIMGWAKPVSKQGNGSGAAEGVPNGQPGPLPDSLDEEQRPPQDHPEILVALNGEATVISRNQYESMLSEKDRLLSNARLLVDKASGTAFAKTGDRWKKITFRGRRKGPFLLLCVYARHPASVCLRPPPWKTLHHRRAGIPVEVRPARPGRLQRQRLLRPATKEESPCPGAERRPRDVHSANGQGLLLRLLASPQP